MIFLCFANKDRYTIAESVLYHLENFGVSVWYDRHSLIIGDNRENINFQEGIRSNHYAILLITPNIADNICANEEILVVKEQYEKGEMRVFPILYNITASELPVKYRWLRDLIYREVTDKTGTLKTVSSITCRYMKDMVDCLEYRTLYDYISDPGDKIDDSYIKSMLHTYFCIDSNNINSRMTILYALYIYCYESHKAKYPLCVVKPFNLLFASTRLNLEIDFKELSILEYALQLMMYQIFWGKQSSSLLTDLKW